MDSAVFGEAGHGGDLDGWTASSSASFAAAATVPESELDTALRRCRRLLGRINTLQAELAEATVEAAAAVQATGDIGYGFNSMAHRIGHELHLSTSEAEKYLEVGEGLGDRPALAEACRDGAFGLSTASVITRSSEADNEAELVDHAHNLSSGQLSRTCAELRRIRDAAAAIDEPAKPVVESLTLRRKSDGDGWQINGTLGAVHGALLDQQLAQRRSELTDGDHYATNAEAFVDLALNGPGEVSERFLALLSVDLAEFEDHLSDRRANGGQPTPGPTGVTTQHGHMVRDEEIDRIFDGLKLRWMIRRNGYPLWVSQQSRTPPEWMRQVLRLTQPTCVVDGCSRSAALHAHHLIHWEDLPETRFGGMAMLCGHHHRLLHDHADYRLRAHPDEEGVFVLVDAEGAPVHAVPHIECDGGRPPDVDGPSPPLGEPLTEYGLDVILHDLLQPPERPPPGGR